MATTGFWPVKSRLKEVIDYAKNLDKTTDRKFLDDDLYKATDPYRWADKSVKHILSNMQYTGCTVNFKSTTVSYKVHKTVYNDPEDWVVIPNTQEPIIDMDIWERVQEIKKHHRRVTATGRKSVFSGLVYCGDCHSKMYFCAAKSVKKNQEFFRCSAYKENRGTCSIHYIRNVVLKQLVLKTIRETQDEIRNAAKSA